MSTAALNLPRAPGNRILCFVAPKSGMSESKSGLLVVAGQSEAPLEGHVLAVGPKVEGVTAHNRILFSKYAGVTTEIGGREYHIVDEPDVLLVWPATFDLPEALAPAPVDIAAADAPCICHPLDVTGRCPSSSCINAERSPMFDDATAPLALTVE